MLVDAISYMSKTGSGSVNGALRVVAVDVTGLAQRLPKAAGVEARRVGREDPQLDGEGRRVFRPIRHSCRVELANDRIGRAQRLAKSNDATTVSASDWLQVASATPATTVEG